MAKQNEHPSGDARYKALDRVMKRAKYAKDSLLEVLNTAQETFGYLSEDLLYYVANQLKVPISQVYGVATFYSMFSFQHQGEHHCMVCTDPACHIAGGEDVLAATRRYAETSDASITVERATCLGLCDQAPVALTDRIARVDLKSDDVESLFSGQASRSWLQVAGEPRIMTRLIGKLAPTDLDAHRAEGTFAALEKALKQMSPADVIEEVKTSALAGRGGAGFPTGLKWQFTRGAEGTSKYIICNSDESEPGTFKDRVLMEGNPFRVIEGIIIGGYAIGAEQGYIFIRGEYPEAIQIVQEAIDNLYEAGLLGKNILDTDFSFDLTIRCGAGAYICGEETALFEAIEGKRGIPRTKPPYPTTHGVFNKPTAINNVETLALIPDIVLNGGKWLRQWGTEKSSGVKLFCLSGHIKQPGVVEAPYGITVRQLVEEYGGGFDSEPAAILMGGAAGGFLHPDNFDTPLTNEALNPLGAPIGSGVIMVFNQGINLLDVLKTIVRFFVHESCGQCTPCRIGTVQIYNMLDKLISGNGVLEDLDKLEQLCYFVSKGSLCGLGASAPNPVLSTLRYFRYEYEALIPEQIEQGIKL